MLSRKLTFAAAAALISIPAVASAQVIDGVFDAAYGTPLFVQDTATGFGNNTDPSTLTASGSEIDSIYANIAGGNLNLLVTGNLETNFNRLVLFFDTAVGGDNVVGTTPTNDPGALGSYNGLTFDTDFLADQFLVVNGGGTPTVFFADYANIGGTREFIGQTPDDGQSTTFNNGIVFGLDNSNILGVDDVSALGAAAVLTGFEFQIPLSVLGNPTGDIAVAGFVSSGDGFVSNQVIGGVNGASNLGTASGVNFSQIPGSQFVVVSGVIPEPASLGLLSVAGLGLLRRRK